MHAGNFVSLVSMIQFGNFSSIFVNYIVFKFLHGEIKQLTDQIRLLAWRSGLQATQFVLKIMLNYQILRLGNTLAHSSTHTYVMKISKHLFLIYNAAISGLVNFGASSYSF